MNLAPTARAERATASVPARQDAGFTLLELLLALAVSGLVLSVISTVYFGALQLRNRTAGAYDEALPLQQAVAMIKRDLAALQPPGGTLTGEFQSTAGTGTSTGLSLFPGGELVSPLLHTATGIIDEYSPFADVQQVAYFLVDPTNAVAPGRDLVRVVSANLLPATTAEAASRWLLGGVETVRFQYFDGLAWLDTWDSTTTSNLPVAIKVQIALATEGAEVNLQLQEPFEIVVPVLARNTAATTNPGNGP